MDLDQCNVQNLDLNALRVCSQVFPLYFPEIYCTFQVLAQSVAMDFFEQKVKAIYAVT